MNNPYQEILVVFSKKEISKEKLQDVYKLFSQLQLILINIKNLSCYYNSWYIINTFRGILTSFKIQIWY